MSNPGANRRAGTLRKLVRITLLGVLLVPFGSVAEADTITCSFGTPIVLESEISEEGCNSTTDPSTNIFDWGDYLIKLTFEGLTSSFDVSINNLTMNPGSGEEGNNFEDRDDNFENYQCITIAGDDCIDFAISAPDRTDPLDPYSLPKWTAYEITFFWLEDTNDEFPNGDGPIGQVRVLHNQDGGFLGDYTRDMCLLTGEGEGCLYSATGDIPGDPAIRTRDTDFSSFTVAWVAVPEPSSLLLLGIGVAGVLSRRRSATGRATGR